MKIKKRHKPIIAALLAAVLVITICMPILFSSSSADAASSGDTISDVLSKYQFFVEGDATLSGGAHTVGAIAVGGTYTNQNTFGDAAIVPSYIGTWASGGKGNGWNGTPPEGFTKNNTVYYGKAVDGVSVDLSWIQDADYINMKNEFSAIRAQSEAISKIGTQVTADDVVSGEITLTCGAGDTYFVLPFDVFHNANSINIVSPNGDVDYFQNNVCVISIIDVEENQVTLDNWSKVKINGIHMSQALEKMSGQDSAYDKQLNFSGMNLIFNLPDASGDIGINGLGGHLVAPNSAVDTGYADYEGGIIAKTLTGSSQGHFYPMSKSLLTGDVPTPTPTTEPTTEPTVAPTTKPTTEPTTGDVDDPENNGELVIIVYDEESGDVVPGATVKVTYPDGSIKEYDTDSEGKIILTELPAGDYEVETVKVPDGYTVTLGKTHSAVVVDGERTECKVYIATNAVSTDDTTEATTEDDNTNKTNTNQVKTGDSFRIIIPLSIMICAIAGAVILYISKKKEDN